MRGPGCLPQAREESLTQPQPALHVCGGQGGAPVSPWQPLLWGTLPIRLSRPDHGHLAPVALALRPPVLAQKPSCTLRPSIHLTPDPPPLPPVPGPMERTPVTWHTLLRAPFQGSRLHAGPSLGGGTSPVSLGLHRSPEKCPPPTPHHCTSPGIKALHSGPPSSTPTRGFGPRGPLPLLCIHPRLTLRDLPPRRRK